MAHPLHLPQGDMTFFERGGEEEGSEIILRSDSLK